MMSSDILDHGADLAAPDKENFQGVRNDAFSSSNRRSFGSNKRWSVGLNRRNSGLSSAGSVVDTAEQSKLADMYSQIIKLSSENKINAKNSWSLNLIDHMDSMILGESGSRNRVNFQKASCTLDASIKIYSYRVDETAASTYRVLENLNRTGESPAKDATPEHDKDDNSEVGSESEGVPKKNQKHRRARPSHAETLEKNPSALNINELEREYYVDPLFRKMSKTFDEAGSRGMLLLNLGVSQGCSITFDSTDVGSVKEDENESQDPLSFEKFESREAEKSVDVSQLKQKLLEMCGDIVSVPLCPQFEELREELVSLGEPMALALSKTANSLMPQKVILHDLDSQPCMPSMIDCGGGDYDSDGGDFPPTCHSQESNNTRASFGSVFAPDAEIIWGGTVGRRISTSVADKTDTVLMDRLCMDIKNGDDEYAYFNKATLSAANQWAGHSHWKYAAIKGSKSAQNNKTTSAGENSKRARKAAFYIDFDAPPVDTGILSTGKSKRNSKGKKVPQKADNTLIPAASLQRASTLADSGAFTLPKDLNFKVRDLKRLFLRPAASARIGPEAGEFDSQKKGFVSCSDPDIIASVFNVDGVDFLEQNYMSNSYEGSGDISDMDDDVGGFNFNPCDTTLNEDGLINDDFVAKDLLKADRLVEKVEVKYASRAKKVDVRKLKKRMWERIDSAIILPKKLDDCFHTDPMKSENEQENLEIPAPSLMFSNVLEDVSAKEDQSEVTVSYYFICLLHLANEKGLKLEGSEDLRDFKISSDPVYDSSR